MVNAATAQAIVTLTAIQRVKFLPTSPAILRVNQIARLAIVFWAAQEDGNHRRAARCRRALLSVGAVV